MNSKNKKAIIIGGSKGIGKAITENLNKINFRKIGC